MTSRSDELIQNKQRPHKIVLDYGKGHRELLDVSETMTLAQLYEHASRRSSETTKTTTAAAAVTVTLKSCVPRPRILEHSPHALVRATIPPQSRVLVEITVEDHKNDDEKQTKNSNDKIIDLSAETDSDDDRECTTIAPHSPPTKCAKRIHPDTGSSSSSRSSDQSAADTDDLDDPTTVDHKPWIYQYGKSPYRDQKVLGKWLVFDSATKIAQTWQTIRQAVASAIIPSAAAKVSTLWQQQNNSHHKSYVICVYTSVERMDDVAHALIPLVRRNISFKTDEATGSNRYAYNSDNAKVTTKTLYWNRGRPTFTKNTAKLMTPVEALKLAVQTAAQYKKKNTDVSLDYSFDIIVTCSGIQHHIPDLAQRRQLWTEGQGATELVLIRDPDNKFDPKYAIRVELRTSDTNNKCDTDTGACIASAAPQQNNSTNSREPPPPTVVVGYVVSTAPPHYARLLAPFLDRRLLSIDSATCAHWVNRDCTAVDIAVSGRAVSEAQPVLDAFL